MELKEVLTLMLGIINLLVLGLSGVLWMGYQDMKRKVEDAAEFKLYCARTYVTQEGLTKAIQNLESTVEGLVQAIKVSMEQNRQDFRDIYSKIDGKQDKDK